MEIVSKNVKFILIDYTHPGDKTLITYKQSILPNPIHQSPDIIIPHFNYFKSENPEYLFVYWILLHYNKATDNSTIE